MRRSELDVVTIAHAIVAQNVTVVPEFLDYVLSSHQLYSGAHSYSVNLLLGELVDLDEINFECSQSLICESDTVADPFPFLESFPFLCRNISSM